MIVQQRGGQISTSALIEQTEREIHRRVSPHLTDSTNSFELFRRACVLRDEHAWAGICQLYSNLVATWILQRMSATTVTASDLASLSNASFARFARSISPEKFASFSSIAQLLGYLKLCTRSAVLDELRDQRSYQLYEQTIEAIEDAPLSDDPADLVIKRLQTGETWQVICRFTKSLEERLILQYLCALGCSPRELQQFYPTHFASVDDIYRMKRNLMERLRRNHQLLALLTTRRTAL